MRLRTTLALGLAALLPLVHSLPAGAQRSTAKPALPAPARARPPVRAEVTVPFKVGETLSYDVSWASVLVAGSATVVVRERKPSFNSTAYYIVAEGRPLPILARLYSLYYKMDSLLDTYTTLSQRGSLYAEEGSEHRTATTMFDRPGNRVFFEEQSATRMKYDYPVPAEAQDGLSTLYGLRLKAFKTGQTLTIPVADSGSLYTLRMTVGAPEPVKVPAGDMSAWRVRGFITDAEGQPVWDNIAVWISTDARRLPVKMQADLPVGAFVLALRSAN